MKNLTAGIIIIFYKNVNGFVDDMLKNLTHAKLSVFGFIFM